MVSRLRPDGPPVSEPTFVGVDGTPDGWVAVRYAGREFRDVRRYGDVRALWRDSRDAATMLVDVPIGLAADSAARAPEREARARLGDRASSVFNVPIRPVLDVDEYAEANRQQREAIGKGLQKQTYRIVPKIREVDELLRETAATQETVREAHPEVCFWALNGREPTTHSKTGRPAAAFWERVAVLERTDPGFRDALFAAGETVAEWERPELSNDDLLDAFALAVTASDLTGSLETLPPDPETDGEGLRAEMVYAEPA